MGTGAALTFSGRVQMLTDMHEDGWLLDEHMVEDPRHHISRIIMDILDDMDIYGPEDDPLDGYCSRMGDSENEDGSAENVEEEELFDAKYYGMDDSTPFPITEAVNGLQLRSFQVDSLSVEGIVVNTVTPSTIVKDVNALHHYEEFKLFDATRYGMIGAGGFLGLGKDAYDVNFGQEALVKPLSYD